MSVPTRRVRPVIDVPSVDTMVQRVPEVLERNHISVERRDPSAATRSLRYLQPNHPSPPDWNAHTAFELAYYMSVVVYACVRLQANTVASLPFRVGADPTKPNDFDVNAPLAKLLGPPPGGPAPKLSARRLWAWTTAQRIVSGRNGWEIESDNSDVPVALWPLAASYLTPKKTLGGIEWFSGFTYGRSGDTRNLTTEQVCYDWDPSGTDFREPESALRAANLDVSVSIMQSRYDYAFLKNDARPPAIIVTEEFEDEDAYRAFQDQWNTRFAGVDNAGRAAFLEAKGAGEQGVKGAVDVTVLGISPKDAQAAQRHTAAMERTAIGLGTPWSLLDASGRTFSNAGAEWRTYVVHRILPFLADLQDMVNMQLAPRLGGNVGWFDVTSLGVKDMDRLDAQGVATLREAGIITKNEGRAPFGLPAVDGGDIFEKPPAPIPATPIKITASAEEDEVRDPVPVPTRQDGAVREPEVLPPSGSAPTSEEREARRARLWNTANGRVQALERQWQRAMRKMFARQSRSAIARLEGKRGRQLVRDSDVRASANEVFDPAHWTSETIDDVTGLYEAVVAAGGARVSDLLGIAFDLEAAWAQEFIQARANQLAGQVTSTTYDAIQSALREGVSSGEGIPELADRIRTVFEEASSSRAKTIARTETISAFNGSASLTATNYGSDVVAGQEWIAELDDATRESHAELDGTVIGMDETFSNGLAYPGDPSGDPDETINCRCTIAFLTPDEMKDAGRARMIERRMAHAVLALVQVGQPLDERHLRSALAVAA